MCKKGSEMIKVMNEGQNRTDMVGRNESLNILKDSMA
jgi:hypothetical protein